MRALTVTCALLALAFALPAAAEDLVPTAAPAKGPVVFDRYPDALGVYADPADELRPFVGLSYQRWLGKLGLLAAASVNVSTAADYASDAALIGEVLWRVYAEDYAPWLSGSLYLVALAGAGYGQEEVYTADALSIKGPYLRALGGAGIGFQVALFGHFSTDLQFLYRLVYKNGFDIGLAPGFSLAYRY